MMFAVIELALVFLLSTSLDAASDGAARRIRTGQFQDANQTAADFKNKICADMTWFASNCSSSLIVHVTTHDTYAGIQSESVNPVKIVGTSRTAEPDRFPAAKIPPERIVVVRSHYRWPLITPFLNAALARLDNGVALISSTQAFVTEPYE
jgi:Flp pilus assembly protein TadG